jgi:hypothetical protein
MIDMPTQTVVVQTAVDNVVGPWEREWLDLFAAATRA